MPRKRPLIYTENIFLRIFIFDGHKSIILEKLAFLCHGNIQGGLIFLKLKVSDHWFLDKSYFPF